MKKYITIIVLLLSVGVSQNTLIHDELERSYVDTQKLMLVK